jgi:glyoxylase I family protein
MCVTDDRWYNLCGSAAELKCERTMPNQRTAPEATRPATAPETDSDATTPRFHGVRYQVTDVARSSVFYSTHLGFKIEHQQLPAFASLSLGPLDLLLSGPGASGSRQMPDGSAQEPGGWTRIVLRVTDLQSWVERLSEAGLRFRNSVETGPGGKQIQLADPDDNPIELFEPRR